MTTKTLRDIVLMFLFCIVWPFLLIWIADYAGYWGTLLKAFGGINLFLGILYFISSVGGTEDKR